MIASTFTLNINWLEKNTCMSNNYALSITTIKLRSSVLNYLTTLCVHNFNSINDRLAYSIVTHWTSLKWKWHTWTLNICFLKAFVIEIESFLMHFYFLFLPSLGKNNLNLVAWLFLLKFLTRYQFDLIFFHVFFFLVKKGLITQLSW
jgi:hypothetical protein